MKQRFTAQQHIEFAKTVRNLYNTSIAAFAELSPHLPKNHPAPQKLRQVIHALEEVKSSLDSEYHKVADNETFALNGHVYYSNRMEPDPPVFLKLTPASLQSE